MTLPKTHPKTGQPLVPVGYIRGKAIWPILGASPDDPSGEKPAEGSGEGDDPDKGKKSAEKTIPQAELSRLLAKEKGEGKRAAEKALADQLGCTLAEAAAIVKKHREAEDETKSAAQKEREAAVKEREAAEAEKRAATVEVHEARIERALAASGLATAESEEGTKKLQRLRKMVTVEAGASYADVLADVQDVKKDFPELFAGKADSADDGKPKNKLPNSDPQGKPAKLNGGEDKYDAGAKRFAADKAKHVGFNPLAKQTT